MREDIANVPEPEPTGYRSEIRDMKIPARYVKSKIRKLRVDGAAGPDRIGPLMLKKLAEEIAWPLSKDKVMHSSLREGVVPEDWRTANVHVRIPATTGRFH
jgi:hypothetical protein